MSDIAIELIKQLRDRTQASFADCRMALEETAGDIEEAAKRLRIRGAAIAQNRGDREAGAGIIESYIHGNGKIGVMLDLRTETDFVARAPEFKNLAHDIAMHVAAANPKYVSPADIPENVCAEERRLIKQQFEGSGKPPQVIEKIVSGKLEALAKDICLLAQPFVKAPDKTVQNVLDEAVAKFGEKIVIRRFERYQI